jgi:hypothetical protein
VLTIISGSLNGGTSRYKKLTFLLVICLCVWVCVVCVCTVLGFGGNSLGFFVTDLKHWLVERHQYDSTCLGTGLKHWAHKQHQYDSTVS